MSRTFTAAQMPQPQAVPVEAPTLGSLARDALADCDGQTEAATQKLTERLLSDGPLLRMVIEEAVHNAVSTRVQASVRGQRQALMGLIANPPKLDGATLTAVLSRNLLDFPLARGLRLGDATKADVLAQVNLYDAQASDMARKARWLIAVAKATPPHKTVGAVLSADNLERMFEKARL
jgi:hypothetical protein